MARACGTCQIFKESCVWCNLTSLKAGRDAVVCAQKRQLAFFFGTGSGNEKGKQNAPRGSFRHCQRRKKRLFRGAKLIVGVGACVRNTAGRRITHVGKHGKVLCCVPTEASITMPLICRCFFKAKGYRGTPALSPAHKQNYFQTSDDKQSRVKEHILARPGVLT